MLLPMCVALGCGGYDVQVKLEAVDERGSMPSVETHLIAVKNTDEYKRLHDMSMSDYWNNVQIDENTRVMKLGEGRDNPQVLSKTDSIWRKQWKDAKLLFILTSYPHSSDMPGNADPRRLILPLEKTSWDKSYWGSDTIPVVIKPQGSSCRRAYKPWNPFKE